MFAPFSDDNDPQKNPFTVPADNDIFMLRDKEREKAKLVYKYVLSKPPIHFKI